MKVTRDKLPSAYVTAEALRHYPNKESSLKYPNRISKGKVPVVHLFISILFKGHLQVSYRRSEIEASSDRDGIAMTPILGCQLSRFTLLVSAYWPNKNSHWKIPRITLLFDFVFWCWKNFESIGWINFRKLVVVRPPKLISIRRLPVFELVL